MEKIHGRSRIDTAEELNDFQHGGILPYVLRQPAAGRAGCPPRARSRRSSRELRVRARPLGLRAKAAAAVFREAAGRFADVSRGRLGRVERRAQVEGQPGTGPCLAVIGHIDEIGLVVRHIDDDGFLRFDLTSAAGTPWCWWASGST